MSNFSFSLSVFNKLVFQAHKNQGLFWKGLFCSGHNLKSTIIVTEAFQGLLYVHILLLHRNCFLYVLGELADVSTPMIFTREESTMDMMYDDVDGPVYVNMTKLCLCTLLSLCQRGLCFKALKLLVFQTLWEKEQMLLFSFSHSVCYPANTLNLNGLFFFFFSFGKRVICL